MTAGPTGVAERRDSLPAPEAAADPLQRYCPDLDQWPASWAYEARDIPHGLRIVECFKPFLREMLALPLSHPTLRRHRDNIWALGGEVISRLQMDSGLRRRPIEQVVLELIGNDGGPLLSHGQSETEQRCFDATCRRLFRCLRTATATTPQAQRGDEPIASLTAPMQNSPTGGSRSSPAAAKRCAAGAGLDRDPHGRGTIGRAVR
jgi:hypothetical protein